MTIRTQLEQIKVAIDTWAKGKAIKVGVAQGPEHAGWLLSQSPGAGRVYICFASEMKRGEYEESGEVDRLFNVILSRPTGLKAEPGDSLMDGADGGPAMFDLLEELRAVVRAVVFTEPADDPMETTEVSPNYQKMEPFVWQGYRTDAYQIDFSIGCQLPAVR
jgi:hypothetical protein